MLGVHDMNVRGQISALWSISLREEGRQLQAGPALEKDTAVFFTELYHRYYTRVLAYVRFRLGRLDYAEDLTSQIFERAFTHLQDLQNMDAAGSWLFRIARNCVADYFRRYRPEVSLERLLHVEHPLQESPETLALDREEAESLLFHLGTLSEREREVIGLKFVAQLSNNEIAHILHIPAGTVGSHLYRGLRRLRDALHAEGKKL